MRIYLGMNSEKRKEFLKLDEGIANHIFILGQSGAGKTLWMRALAEEIFSAYREQDRPVYVIILERKHDPSKLKHYRRWWLNLPPHVRKEWEGTFVEVYMRKALDLANTGYNPGDFALGLPNYPMNLLKWTDNRTGLLSAHGLKPEAFPNNRIIFYPDRSKNLQYIRFVNGPRTDVYVGKIPFSVLRFEHVRRFIYVNPSTNYGRILKDAFDVYHIKKPEDIIEVAKQHAFDAGKDLSPRTMQNILSVVKILKTHPLFTADEKEAFWNYLSTDRINVIDFSANSRVIEFPEEEELVLRQLIDYVIRKARYNNIPVYFFIDEIQDFIFGNRQIARQIDRLFRLGRSMNITVIASTQYLHSLPSYMLEGAKHFAVLGYFSSDKDKQKVMEFTKAAKRIKIKKEQQIKPLVGWFVEEKRHVKRIYFRPPVSF